MPRIRKRHMCPEQECPGDSECVRTRFGRRCLCPLAKSVPYFGSKCPTVPPSQFTNQFKDELEDWPRRSDLVRYEGACKFGVCGPFAACMGVSQGAQHLCICPSDVSSPLGNSPSDFICPSYAEYTFDGNNSLSSNASMMFHKHFKNTNRSDNKHNVQTQQMAASSATPPWMLAATITLPVILTVLLILALLARRRSKLAKKITGQQSNNNINTDINKQEYEGGTGEDVACSQFNPIYYNKSLLEHLKNVPHISSGQVVGLTEIGRGCFGKVYKGSYRATNTTAVSVAVKQLRETDCTDLACLANEVDIMASCQHRNIVSFIGVLMQDDQSLPCIVYEYMCHGNLVELLRTGRSDNGSVQGYNTHGFTTEILYNFARDIASGMEYLSSQHFVHRDLACRNVLVGRHLVAKVSDFGLSRDVYTNDYYKVAGGARRLPVRWMAPECINYGKFTFEGDIWSYGVVLWEIFAKGKQPYYGYSNEEVVQIITRHVLLVPPQNCTATICNIMQMCWQIEAKHRTTFSDIVALLHDKNLVQQSVHEVMCATNTVDFNPADNHCLYCSQQQAELQLDNSHYLLPNTQQNDYIQPIP